MRLIDADALIKIFEVLRDEHETHSISYNALYEVLVQQPTAYSVEKVVEELEEVAYVSEDVNSFVDLEDAIEIVKQGGVSDDVCEWKQDKTFVGMYKNCSGYVTYLKGFKYCPYCGKKIKVVE